MAWDKARSDRYAVVIAEIAVAEGLGQTPTELYAERAAIVVAHSATFAGLSSAEIGQRRAALLQIRAGIISGLASAQGRRAVVMAEKRDMVAMEIETAEAVNAGIVTPASGARGRNWATSSGAAALASDEPQT